LQELEGHAGLRGPADQTLPDHPSEEHPVPEPGGCAEPEKDPVGPRIYRPAQWTDRKLQQAAGHGQGTPAQWAEPDQFWRLSKVCDHLSGKPFGPEQGYDPYGQTIAAHP